MIKKVRTEKELKELLKERERLIKIFDKLSSINKKNLN